MRGSARVARNELLSAYKELADVAKRVDAALTLLERILKEPKP